MANIALGEAECYICHKILIKSCILSYKRSGSILSVLLYFTLTKVSAKYSSLVILTHLLNKSFLIKCVYDLAFYNYSSVEEGGHTLSATNFIYVICVIYIPKCSKWMNTRITLCVIRVKILKLPFHRKGICHSTLSSVYSYFTKRNL